jgi:hypothetical protein
MDVACPSLPLKILAADKLPLTPKHTPRMAAVARRLVVCSLCVQLINIGFLRRATVARAFLYKVGPLILSSTFWKTISGNIVSRNFDNCYDERVALAQVNNLETQTRTPKGPATSAPAR